MTELPLKIKVEVEVGETGAGEVVGEIVGGGEVVGTMVVGVSEYHLSHEEVVLAINISKPKYPSCLTGISGV